MQYIYKKSLLSRALNIGKIILVCFILTSVISSSLNPLYNFDTFDIFNPDAMMNTNATIHPPMAGAYASGHYRNLFAELGYSNSTIQQKLENVWQQLFYGNDDDQRVYYPAGSDMAYIKDIGNGDVRSEGMSYGLMIAVQLNKQDEFNRLWKWARTYMYHDSGDHKGYFAWQCTTSGSVMDHNAASDGDEWFAMSLFFAAGRWGNGAGIYNYQTEAQGILHNMLHHGTINSVTNMFDATQKQVVFVPYANGATFTDPSYHLPAYYQLWSLWSKEDQQFWADTANTSRAFFKTAANPDTGLMPDYADFTGQPHNDGGHGDLRFDAWRVASNIGVDYSWFAADPWQKEQSDRLQSFFMKEGMKTYANQYSVSGSPLSSDHSTGLVAMNAVASLAATKSQAWKFVDALWHTPVPSGKWRYYDGMLYTLALLEVSGNFRIYAPPGEAQNNPQPIPTTPEATPTATVDKHTPKQTPTPASGSQIAVEAELASNSLSGGARAVACSACSGGQKITGIGKGGTLLFNSFKVDAAGDYTLSINYINADTSPRQISMSLNYGSPVTITFPGKGNANTIGTAQVKVHMQTGYNSIKFYNDSATGPDLDRIAIHP
ncbi:hypothetical protein KDW_37210 [Dictyobacter vulcani]|uniref:CBM6 domain-containing protein n=1 Tax=Dictyobacter vulcani TaxID=2607529 RepID=A0A5J4KU28_9CHLR|nr:glycosyl hydrolase family 8 [Dictyobacter vulcani]GER89559.1 hypothetical protein KDW_37210 [Dictyobacter vulcani]